MQLASQSISTMAPSVGCARECARARSTALIDHRSGRPSTNRRPQHRLITDGVVPERTVSGPCRDGPSLGRRRRRQTVLIALRIGAPSPRKLLAQHLPQGRAEVSGVCVCVCVHASQYAINKNLYIMHGPGDPLYAQMRAHADI